MSQEIDAVTSDNLIDTRTMTKQEYFAKAKVACDQLKELEC